MIIDHLSGSTEGEASFYFLPITTCLLSLSATHKITSTSTFIVSMRAVNNDLVNVCVQI